MMVRRLYAPRAISTADVALGRVESHYRKVLVRLLAAHATAQKLTAYGYERALDNAGDALLRASIIKTAAEARGHVQLVYRLLEELGVSERSADQMMIVQLKAPSFEAPRCFAEHPADELGVLMAGIALDMTGLLMLGINYSESSYEPYARTAEVILTEEPVHELFRSELLATAVERFGKEQVAAALREWLPRAVNCFGPPGSGFTYDCLRYGLKSRDNQELAELYLTVLERRAAQLGLALPRLSNDYPRRAT